MSQTYSRYSAHDFERRWQKRLSTPPRRVIDDLSPLHVKVTHRFQAPNRYSWELRPATGLPVEESRASALTVADEKPQPPRRARLHRACLVCGGRVNEPSPLSLWQTIAPRGDRLSVLVQLDGPLRVAAGILSKPCRLIQALNSRE